MYSTWDDVINRWIGKQKADLYLELGPPNLHPKEAEDGTIEMVWDMTIDPCRDRLMNTIRCRFMGAGIAACFSLPTKRDWSRTAAGWGASRARRRQCLAIHLL